MYFTSYNLILIFYLSFLHFDSIIGNVRSLVTNVQYEHRHGKSKRSPSTIVSCPCSAVFDSERSTSSYLHCQVWNSGQQCHESVIQPDTERFFSTGSYTPEEQYMPGDSMAFQSNNFATHEGLFNTNTSCNFKVHPALGCQVSNSCYNITGLSGLGDSVHTLAGVRNTYYALVRELDNSDVLRGNFSCDEKQYDGELHEPHGSIDLFNISIDTIDLSTFSLLSCKVGGSQHITPQDVSRLTCTEHEVASGYIPNNMQSKGESNAPTPLTR